MYTSPLSSLPCQVYDSTKTAAALEGCCSKIVLTGPRACKCTSVLSTCDCWVLPGTGTTGGPWNVWDYTFPIDDYTGCTSDCCVGTCECCEPNLETAGYISGTDTLTWTNIGASSWSLGLDVNITRQINECIIFPDGQLGPGGAGRGAKAEGKKKKKNKKKGRR